MAKIINGKLVIRVGGGYMSADEFIDQYGKIEMMKMRKAEEQAAGVVRMSKKERKTRNAKSFVGLHEFKDMMRESIAKQFEGDASHSIEDGYHASSIGFS